MEERRGCRRYPVSLPARAIIDSTQLVCEGMVTDISFSGIRFVCSENIANDEHLAIRFEIEGQDINLKAVVVWSALMNDPDDVNHGLKIIGVVVEGDRKVLENFFKKFQG